MVLASTAGAGCGGAFPSRTPAAKQRTPSLEGSLRPTGTRAHTSSSAVDRRHPALPGSSAPLQNSSRKIRCKHVPNTESKCVLKHIFKKSYMHIYIYVCAHILLTAVRTIKPMSDNYGQRCGFDVTKTSSDFMKEHISIYLCAC